jgi:predicted metal-dependent enzyme (double-stranded beta helix superfamily)
MNNTHMTLALSAALLAIGLGARWALADDATKVAPTHYKVEFENDKVRVLRITYAPGEESAMHEHKDGVVVNLSNFTVQFKMADGTSPAAQPAKPGEFQWSPAQMHSAKNVGNARAEALFIELKH